MDLITRRVIAELEGTEEVSEETVQKYSDFTTPEYKKMTEAICQKLNFTSLRYQSLEGMLEAIGIDPDDVCTYCWNGKE